MSTPMSDEQLDEIRARVRIVEYVGGEYRYKDEPPCLVVFLAYPVIEGKVVDSTKPAEDMRALLAEVDRLREEVYRLRSQTGYITLLPGASWVPVAERLPEPNKRVVFLRTWDGWKPEFRPQSEMGHIDESGKWILEAWQGYHPMSEYSCVTHWIDLPAQAVANE